MSPRMSRLAPVALRAIAYCVPAETVIAGENGTLTQENVEKSPFGVSSLHPAVLHAGTLA